MSLMDNANNNNSRIYGVEIGIVTNIKDPDKLGRVKITLPQREADSKGQRDEYWARIATTMAGKDRGTFFLPEVDDEVLVAFLGGNLNYPYIIGMLWNKKDIPPEKNEDGKNNIKQIRSRSGHDIILDDTDGKEKVIIQSKGENKIIFDDKSGKESILIQDKSKKNQIKIDSTKKCITIEADAKIEIKSKSSTITLDGNANSIELKSSGTLKIDSNQIQVKAGAMLDLKSRGNLSINGAIVKIN